MLAVIFAAFNSNFAQAQNGPQASAPSGTGLPTAEEFAVMIKEAKVKQVPMLIAKAGLTDAQAQKVVEANFEVRMAAGRLLKDVSDADRAAKIAELKAIKEKKYSEFLSPEQIKAVYAAYEDMGKNMPGKG